jgi:hypothetical protein
MMMQLATPAAKTAIDAEILRLISVLFFIVASPNPVVGNCVVALFFRGLGLRCRCSRRT